MKCTQQKQPKCGERSGAAGEKSAAEEQRARMPARRRSFKSQWTSSLSHRALVQYTCPEEQLAKILNAPFDPRSGLSADFATRRLRKEGANLISHHYDDYEEVSRLKSTWYVTLLIRW